MNLKVQKIDSYQFIGKEFSLVVTLPDSFPDISRRTSNLPLKVDAFYEGEQLSSDAIDRNFNPNFLEVISNTNIDRSRRGVVTCRLNEASSTHNNRKFVIRFMAFTLEGDLTSVVGYSVPIKVVRYRLKILEEFAEHGSYIWMKDVGGKDKSIDLQVSLVDIEGSVITNRRVPLRVELLYSNGSSVPQQDILQLSPDSQLAIGTSGSTRIKCRINEVSSRHQGQLFQVLISPDGDGLTDISPGRSVPVEVKSKINFTHKRKLQAMNEVVNGSNASLNGSSFSVKNEAGGSDSSLGGAVGEAFRLRRSSGGNAGGVHTIPSAGTNPLGSNISQLVRPPSFNNINSNTSNNSSSAAMQGSTTTTSSSSGTNSVGTALNENGTDTMATLSGRGTHALSSILPLSSVFSSSIGDPASRSSALPLSTAVVSNPSAACTSTRLVRPTPITIASGTVPAGLPTTGTAPSPQGSISLPINAVKELVSFVEVAYFSLVAMQWTPIGQLPAVNPETGMLVAGDRVLYNMPNPNSTIAAITERYQKHVLPQLGTVNSLLAQSAQTTPTPPSTTGSSSHGAARPSPVYAVPSSGQPQFKLKGGASKPAPVLDSNDHDCSSQVLVEPDTRLVYTDKCVYALLSTSSSSTSEPQLQQQQHELGLAAFGCKNGKHQFIGFYSKDANGNAVFRDFRDLLKSIPGGSAAAAAPSLSNNKKDDSQEQQQHRAVTELLSFIGAAEILSCLPLSRSPRTGMYDTSALNGVWRDWSPSERLLVHID